MRQEVKEELLSIDDLSRKCGYFTTDTIINNGYGCNHPYCYDGVYTYNGKQINLSDAELIVAKGFTKRNIKCNRRLSKKFIKKARWLLFSEWIDLFGVKFQGACYAFSCPLGRLAYPEDFPKFGMSPEDCGDDEYVIIETKNNVK